MVGRTPGPRGTPSSRSFFEASGSLPPSKSRPGGRQRTRGSAPPNMQVCGRGKTKWHWAEARFTSDADVCWVRASARHGLSSPPPRFAWNFSGFAERCSPDTMPKETPGGLKARLQARLPVPPNWPVAYQERPKRHLRGMKTAPEVSTVPPRSASYRPYSPRKVIAGSTRAARRAGNHAATSAAAPSSAVSAANVSGSIATA